MGADDEGGDGLSVADLRKLGIQPPPRWIVILEDRCSGVCGWLLVVF